VRLGATKEDISLRGEMDRKVEISKNVNQDFIGGGDMKEEGDHDEILSRESKDSLYNSKYDIIGTLCQ
jgi:hypothetical protein